MTRETAPIVDGEFAVFAEKLGRFRTGLEPREQHLFDALLLAAANGDDGDVQGYRLPGAGAKHLALASVVALGIVGGTLGPVLGGSALAAPQEQPTLNGNRGGFAEQLAAEQQRVADVEASRQSPLQQAPDVVDQHRAGPAGPTPNVSSSTDGGTTDEPRNPLARWTW
jgi:hypothetical protein